MASQTRTDEDLSAIVPTSNAKLAGALLAGAGVVTGVLGIQSWLLLVRAPLWVVLMVVLMFAMVPVAMFLAWKVARLYGWAAKAGMGASATLTVLSGAWALLALNAGVLSVLAFLIVPVAFTATVFCGISISAGRRADAARARLRHQGLDASL